MLRLFKHSLTFSYFSYVHKGVMFAFRRLKTTDAMPNAPVLKTLFQVRGFFIFFILAFIYLHSFFLSFSPPAYVLLSSRLRAFNSKVGVSIPGTFQIPICEWNGVLEQGKHYSVEIRRFSRTRAVNLCSIRCVRLPAAFSSRSLFTNAFLFSSSSWLGIRPALPPSR